MNTPQLTASLIGRLSKQAKGSNLSLPGMLDDCRSLADRMGATVIAEHVDDGVSGEAVNRTELLAWLDDASSGRANLLIAPTTDRITRLGLPVVAQIVKVLEESGARLLTTDGLDSDTSSFRMQFAIVGELAHGELQRIKARNQATQRRLVEQGRWIGGPIPFGCRVVERLNDAGKLVKYLEAEPTEAAILNDLADKVIAGQSRTKLLRWLAQEGIGSRRGNPFVDKTLVKALSSQGAHKHVFEPAKSRALLLALKPDPDRKRAGLSLGGRGRPQVWLLSRGNGVCDSCGRNLTISKASYVCASPACTAQVGIKAAPVDAWLESEILQAYGSVRWPVVVTEIEGVLRLEEARQAVEDAQAALLAGPNTETLGVFAVAKNHLADLESQPVERTRRVVMSENTFGEDWAAAGIPERAQMLRWAIDGPVRVLPLAKARELPQETAEDVVRGEDGVYRFEPAAETDGPAEPVKVDRRRVNPAARVKYRLAVGEATGWPAK